MQRLFCSALLLFAVLSVALGAMKGDECANNNDCEDPATTCMKGSCQCWLSQGFSTGMTWACKEDHQCEVLFPGHLCRPGLGGCDKPFGDNTGWCQPTGAVRDNQPEKADNHGGRRHEEDDEEQEDGDRKEQRGRRRNQQRRRHDEDDDHEEDD